MSFYRYTCSGKKEILSAPDEKNTADGNKLYVTTGKLDEW